MLTDRALMRMVGVAGVGCAVSTGNTLTSVTLGRKMTKMIWQGKDLKEYSKEELMLIVETLARMAEQQARRHVQDLESLFRPQEV